MSERSPIGRLRPPNRRAAVQVLCVAAPVAALCWYFGVDVWHSILLGCAITVAVLACGAATSAPDISDVGWRAGRKASRDGSRNDVASLSSSLRAGWGLVGLTAERQARQIARRRLALEGLDLADPAHRPAIERRIGGSAYRVLTRQSHRRLRMRTLLSCLDALDTLDPAYYPVPLRRSRVAGARRTPSTSPREDR